MNPRARLLLAVLLLAGAGVLVWSWMRPAPSSPEEGELTLYDLREERLTTLAAALPDLAQAGLVFVGESHSEISHHQAQLAVIRSLHSERRPLAVAMEMIGHKHQKELDAWVRGEISEDHMRAVFSLDWGFAWELYRPIFLYCRAEGIPMLGINVPREITRKVAREGFAALTDEELGLLPPLSCEVHQEYEDFLRAVLGAHGAGGTHGADSMDEEMFQRFCEAQMVWDTAMAIYSLAHLEAYPTATVVVLSGTVHAWKKAIPSQAERLAPDVRQRVLLPQEPGRLEPALLTAEDADYVIIW